MTSAQVRATKPAGAPPPPGSRPIRVMLVDDSVVARTAARQALASSPRIDIVASATNGKSALDQIAAADPDVVILDIEMPVMGGMEALPQLLKRRPDVKVLIVSGAEDAAAAITVRALAAGAAEVLLKPTARGGPDSAERFGAELLRIVLSLGEAATVAPLSRPVAPRARPQTVQAAARPAAGKVQGPPRAIAIGCSTGGPRALVEVFGGWSRHGIKQPVFITQHMPPSFTKVLAEHLRRAAGVDAAEGQDGETVQPGRIYIAPGDRHMLVRTEQNVQRIHLSDGPPVNFCRPAVDPMFESLVAAYGGSLLAVILTGMGQDGRDGAVAVAQGGGRVIAQDEATSVVWGMPGAVAKSGVADQVLALSGIATAIVGIAKKGTSA